MPVWDVLCNIETGKITVHKDIRPPATGASSFPQPPSIGRSGLAIPNISDDETAKSTGANGPINKGEFVAKADNADNLFMEDVSSASSHLGQSIHFDPVSTRSSHLLHIITGRLSFAPDLLSMYLAL
jgi:hypothetical protein